MPMYRRKPEEWRYAVQENRIDIAHWAGLDEDEVRMWYYYNADGDVMAPSKFNKLFEEAE